MKILLVLSLALGALAASFLEGSGRRGPDDIDRTIQVGDIKMGYRSYGDGPPLVLVMGFGSTMNLWEPGLIRALAADFRVIVFDNRGLGTTEAGRRPFSIGQFADDTSGLLEALGLSRVHLLGWSMGSLIAEEVALRHPAQVNRLVLYAAHCDASLFPPAPEVLQKLRDTSGTPEEQGLRFISLLFPADWLRAHGERIKEIFFRPMGPTPPEMIGRQAMAIGEWKGCCDRLAALKKATLLVAGADDILVPVQNSRYLAGRIPGSELAVFDHAGHGLMFQLPAEFAAKVLAFLKTEEPR